MTDKTLMTIQDIPVQANFVQVLGPIPKIEDWQVSYTMTTTEEQMVDQLSLADQLLGEALTELRVASVARELCKKIQKYLEKTVED